MLASSCSEIIDLKTDQKGGELVIFGSISNSTIGNYVEVSRTSDGGEAPAPISDAIVTLFNQQDQSERLRMVSPGKYEVIDNVLRREVGDQFRLEVIIGDKRYTSPLQKINPVVAQDEMSFREAIETNITSTGTEIEEWVVQLYTTSVIDPLPNEFYIRWTIEEAYTHFESDLPRSHFPRWSPSQCYVINNLSEQGVFLLDGTTVRNTELKNRYLVSRKIDRSFASKHYFNLIQSALNEESHKYWSRVDKLVARAGSIFDTPPSAIPSNIYSADSSERVLGHFEVIGVDTTRLLMTNNDIPIFFEDPCKVDTPTKFRAVTRVPLECVSCLVEEKILPKECIFCALTPGFTSERPSYF